MPKDKNIRPEPKTTIEPEQPNEATVADQLRRLGAQLMATAENEVASKATLSQIEEVLGSLKLKDYPDLAESEVVQNFIKLMGVDNLRPGQAIARGTLAEREREWTMKDVQDNVRSGKFPLVKFIPTETVTIIWNGLPIRFPENEEIEVPRPFYDIYASRQRAKREAVKHEAYMFGYSDTPPHHDWQTPEMAEVRLWSTNGRPYGRPGGTIAVGPIPEMEPEKNA